MKTKKLLPIAIIAALSVLLLTTAVFADGGGLWLSAGHDRNNTRSQDTEAKIKPSNVANLVPLWTITTGDGPGGARDDVSATPAVDGEYVYFPDWSGNLFKADRRTGAVIWKHQISEYTGIPGDFSRATPAIYNDLLIFGTQSGQLPNPSAAHVVAVNRSTGNALWVTQADDNFASIVTQSASVFDNRVYVGVASYEEVLAAFIPGYQCCQFRGSMMSLNAGTGQILWKTYMAPQGYSGNAVWGSSPVVDTKRGSIYIGTGNNYSVPADVLACVGATNDPDEQRACLSPDDHYDAIVALDWKTGQVKWSTAAIPFDAWTVGCLDLGLPEQNCPEPQGPDFDFGQAPILFKAGQGSNRQELLGIGQKSGQFWALNPDTGSVVWTTQVSPGGVIGGMIWGSAYDGTYIYTSGANSERKPWTLANGTVTNSGIWSALDPLTGQIVWETANPTPFAPAGGAATVANGVVYACSLDSAGHMYAMDAHTGAILWDFASGGSCNAGAAVVNGVVYWGSGYNSFGATGNDKFYAFGLSK